MKIEELTQEQIEKAKSLATDEERLAYLKECGVELDADMMAEVAGGLMILKRNVYMHGKKPETEEKDGLLVGLMT